MEKGKWFIRAASLTILLGFFVPTMVVSCSGGMLNTGQSFSLFDLANQMRQSILYLLPIAMITIAILTFLYTQSYSRQVVYLWGEAGAMLLGLIGVVGSLFSLSNQIQQGTFGLFEVSLDFGAFVLIGGLILFIVGWIMDWQAMGSPGLTHPISSISEEQVVQPVNNPQPILPVIQPKNQGAYLEVISGDLPVRIIPVVYDNFAIGRSSENQFQLPDRTVSRVHASFRYAQGVWFVQDLGSSVGTIVNGENVQASRLNNGDRLEIGPFVFRFHC
jgi:hypothetical protein